MLTGIDLVIELPTIYSVSSAENFASGAIKILNSLKIVDHLSFGGEFEEINKLNIIANVLSNEPKDYKNLLASELSKGMSFPKARENALSLFLGDNTVSKILSEPNNILAIEYLKALKKLKSKIEPVLIPRKNSGHLNTDYTGSITSSTSIRNMLKDGNTKNLKNALTPHSYTILKEEINNGHCNINFSVFEKTIIYKLRTMNLEDIKNLPDISEGLENSIKKASMYCNNLDDLIKMVKTKRYTQTRLTRIMLYCLLNITKKDMEISKKTEPYIRILGFNSKGKELLGKIKKNNPNVKLVTSVKKFLDENNNKNFRTMMQKDIFATDIYTIGYVKDSYGNLDFTKNIIKR